MCIRDSGGDDWLYRTTPQGAYVASIAKIINLLFADLATGDMHYAKEYVYDLKKKMEESDTGEDSNIIGYPDGHDEDFRPIEEDARPDRTEMFDECIDLWERYGCEDAPETRICWDDLRHELEADVKMLREYAKRKEEEKI